MRGIILSYDYKNKIGLISGDDGNRYTFSRSDWNLPFNPTKGLKVDFEREGKKAKDFVLIPEEKVTEEKPESFVTQIVFLLVLIGFGYFFFSAFSYLGSNGSPEVRDAYEDIKRTVDGMESKYCEANNVKCN